VPIIICFKVLIIVCFKVPIIVYLNIRQMSRLFLHWHLKRAGRE
jgi:hypothetical protein